MNATADQTEKPKPALASLTRTSVLLASTPAVIWLILYFALAAHLRLGLGRWPETIGDNPDTPLFKLHTEVVWRYFGYMLLSVFAVPLIVAVLVFIPSCRRHAVHFVVYAIAVGLAWLLMNLAPGSFVYWFFD